MKQDVVIHKDSPSIHFFSGLLAFIIYLLFFILLVGGFKFYKEQVRYGENEEILTQIALQESIELEEILEESNTQTEQNTETESATVQNIQEAQETQEEKQQETAENTSAPENTMQAEQPRRETTEQVKPKEKMNLADAFSSISSETSQNRRAKEEAQKAKQLEFQRQQALQEAHKIQKARAEQLAQNAAALEQSTKALQEATKNLHQNVKQALTTKISLEKPKFVGNSEDKAKYDEWYVQIEQILMSEWRKSDSFYQAATHAKVKIHIDSEGKLSYLHMVAQSPYGEYNRSVIAFLKRMENYPLPPPPGEGVNLAVDLTNTLRH